MTQSLEDRIARLEAIEEIRLLKARYAEFADAKYVRNPHRKKTGKALEDAVTAQAACFTEDVEWDAGPFGILKGRPALIESFAAKPFWFTLHGYMNPVIEIDGDTATGRWLHWLLVSHEGDAKATHMMGYSNERYRRVSGNWQISHMRLEVLFDVPFGAPWTAMS